MGFFQRGENLFGHNIDRLVGLPVIGCFYRVARITEIVFKVNLTLIELDYPVVTIPRHVFRDSGIDAHLGGRRNIPGGWRRQRWI